MFSLLAITPFQFFFETGLFKPDFLNRIFLHQESGELGLIKRV